MGGSEKETCTEAEIPMSVNAQQLETLCLALREKKEVWFPLLIMKKCVFTT